MKLNRLNNSPVLPLQSKNLKRNLTLKNTYNIKFYLLSPKNNPSLLGNNSNQTLNHNHPFFIDLFSNLLNTRTELIGELYNQFLMDYHLDFEKRALLLYKDFNKVEDTTKYLSLFKFRRFKRKSFKYRLDLIKKKNKKRKLRSRLLKKKILVKNIKTKLFVKKYIKFKQSVVVNHVPIIFKILKTKCKINRLCSWRKIKLKRFKLRKALRKLKFSKKWHDKRPYSFMNNNKSTPRRRMLFIYTLLKKFNNRTKYKKYRKYNFRKKLQLRRNYYRNKNKLKANNLSNLLLKKPHPTKNFMSTLPTSSLGVHSYRKAYGLLVDNVLPRSFTPYKRYLFKKLRIRKMKRRRRLIPSLLIRHLHQFRKKRIRKLFRIRLAFTSQRAKTSIKKSNKKGFGKPLLLKNSTKSTGRGLNNYLRHKLLNGSLSKDSLNSQLVPRGLKSGYVPSGYNTVSIKKLHSAHKFILNKLKRRLKPNKKILNKSYRKTIVKKKLRKVRKNAFLRNNNNTVTNLIGNNILGNTVFIINMYKHSLGLITIIPTKAPSKCSTPLTFQKNYLHSTNSKCFSFYNTGFFTLYKTLFLHRIRTKDFFTNWEKNAYSFLYPNDLEREVLRHKRKILSFSMFNLVSSTTNYKPSLLKKLKKHNTSALYLNSDTRYKALIKYYKHNNFYSNFNTLFGAGHYTQTHFDIMKKKFTLSNKNHIGVKNTNSNLKRIKFKPGYQRIWRTVRSTLKDVLNFRFMYEKKLTRILMYYTSGYKKFQFNRSEVTLNKIMAQSHILPDYDIIESFINGGLVTVNNIKVTNINFVPIPNDFIQLSINHWFYVFSRWNETWSKIKIKKYKRLVYKKGLAYKHKSMKVRKQKSYNIPKWIHNIRLYMFDVRPYLEIDFFTLSVFMIYDPFIFYFFTTDHLLCNRGSIYRLYNWKYIT